MGLEVKIYDTPAGGIRASQGTFSSLDYHEPYFYIKKKCGLQGNKTFVFLISALKHNNGYVLVRTVTEIRKMKKEINNAY